MEQLADGFDLTGSLPEPNVFSRKVRPATMSCDELRRIADLSREGMSQTVKSSGDSELDTQLYSVTQKEVAKGFLVGPLTGKTCRQGLHTDQEIWCQTEEQDQTH